MCACMEKPEKVTSTDGLMTTPAQVKCCSVVPRRLPITACHYSPLCVCVGGGGGV